MCLLDEAYYKETFDEKKLNIEVILSKLLSANLMLLFFLKSFIYFTLIYESFSLSLFLRPRCGTVNAVYVSRRILCIYVLK